MKIQTLRALLSIEQHGSLRAAAQHLHLTQPALTLAIQRLEQELGAQLLSRTKKGVTLTPFGQALMPRARLIVSESVRAQEEIAQLRGDWEGQVRFAASPAFALSVLPHALRPFMLKYPKLRIHYVDGVFPGVAAPLRAGTLDFAITPVKPRDLESDLVSEPLWRSEVVIVANRKHALARARSLAELQEAPWAFATPSGGPGAIIEEAFQDAGLAPPKQSIICESLLALPDIVAASALLATLPVTLLERTRCSEELAVIRVRERLPTLTIAVVRRGSHPLTPASNELIGWVQHVVQSRT